MGDPEHAPIASVPTADSGVSPPSGPSYTEPNVQTAAEPEARTPGRARTDAPRLAPRGLRLGYLLSQYPAVSHTFFLHEVLGLRALGLHLETASINRPDRPPEALPATEAAEVQTTRYIKSGSAAHLLKTAFAHPKVVLRGLLTVFRLPGLTLRKRLLWLLYLAEALLVGQWLRDRRLTHLHVHFGGPVASVGLLTSVAWRIPYSLTIHGPEELLNHEACHLREKLQQASFVLCISDFCRSQLLQLTPPEHWRKFHICRLGVDPSILTPALRSLREPGAPLHLVCTGRLVAAKGHLILLEALRDLLERGLALQATLIGAGPERPALEAFVHRHGLAASVRFTGALSHPETLAHVQRADLFVLASFAEGVPVAFMEAMALAIPCVGTSIAGIPELIRTGREGLLVPPGNVEELASALETLILDPALRRRLGASGRERIVSTYNLPLNHERLAGLFTQLIGHTRPEAR